MASEKAAVAARAEAEKNAQIAGMQATLALATIGDLISRVNDGLNRPGLFDLKTEIIQSALQRVDQVANILQGVNNKEATTLAALTALADIYRQTGELQRAVPIFQKCLVIAKERLIIRNRNSSSRMNLAQIYRNLATCAEQLDRDMNAVVAHLREAQLLYEDILVRPTPEDPKITPSFVRGALSDIHINLGSAYHRLGEINKALEEFRRSFNYRSELLASSKDDPKLIHAAALSSMAMADCSYRLGRRGPAEEYFRQAFDLYEQNAKFAPEATLSRSGLGDYHAQIGVYHFRMGELETARRHFEENRNLYAGLAKADERNAAYRGELAIATARLARLADAEKKPELSRREFEEAARLAEENYRIDEKNDLRRVDLMLLRPHVGQIDLAVDDADRFAAGPKVDAELWTYLAETYAQCARALPPEKAERSQVLLAKAVDAVRQAIRLGFRDRAVLELDHGLDPLRGRDDFKALLRDLPPPG